MKATIDTLEAAVDVVEVLQNAGHQAVFAGGCVRDFLMNKEPADIDIATSATPDQVEALFEKTVAVGKSFGVIRVIHNEEEFEVATFRTDSKTGDGRRPDSVEFSSMEEDAKRRDLTINAIFFDPIADKIYDFVGGQKDIKNRIVRMVGNAESRIEEDKLRILRVIRFSARFGWDIHPHTLNAIKLRANEVDTVSRERIGDELTKILCNKGAKRGLEQLTALGLQRLFMPKEGFTRDISPLINQEGLNKSLAWACVLHPFSQKDIVAHLESLRFDTKMIERTANIIGVQNFLSAFNSHSVSARTKILTQEYFEDAMLLFENSPWVRSRLSDVEFIRHFKASTPISQLKPERLVNGQDLIAMGMKPGRLFKDILDVIDNQQREGIVKNREEAMVVVKELLAQNNAANNEKRLDI